MINIMSTWSSSHVPSWTLSNFPNNISPITDGKHLEAGPKLSSECPDIFRWYSERRSERLNAEYNYSWTLDALLEANDAAQDSSSTGDTSDGGNRSSLKMDLRISVSWHSRFWVIALDLLEIPVKNVFGKTPHQYIFTNRIFCGQYKRLKHSIQCNRQGRYLFPGPSALANVWAVMLSLEKLRSIWDTVSALADVRLNLTGTEMVLAVHSRDNQFPRLCPKFGNYLSIPDSYELRCIPK